MKRWTAETAYLLAIVGIIAATMCGMAAIAKADTPCQPDITFGSAGWPDTQGTTLPAGMVPVTSPGGMLPWDQPGYTASQEIGADNAVRMVTDYATRCPDATIHLYGHSYGAAIMHTAANRLDTAPFAHRLTLTLTGDPRRIGGIEDTLAGATLWPGLTMRGGLPDPGNIPTTNTCHPLDGICRFPDPWRDPIGTVQGIVGYFTGAHKYN